MNGNGFGVKRPAARLLRAVQILFIIFAQLVSALQVPQQVFAAGGAYSLKWYAADPAVNSGPYLPTYVKQPPSQLACPTPSGGVGRAADPMKDAVAYGATFTSNDRDAVTSLAPKDLALGQIVPFEMEISVSGSTAPENGVIQFTSGFNTHTTSSDNFGFDPAYMVYCAFVDTADKGTIDPGANAKVDSWTSTLASPGGGASEEIQGTFRISGLESGDNVIVEIWVVLKPTIPPGAGGNVQTRLIAANTVAATPDTISTGNQTVPLLQVKDFFSSKADVSITKSDSPDPVVLGNQLTYTIVATNNSTDTIANGVVVTDNLDPNTTFVSGTWPGGACTAASGVVTCNIGALAQGSSVTITIVVSVKTTAPTAGTVQTGACTVGAPGVDLCNIATVTAITADPNTANNSASAPTDVTGTPTLSLTKTASPATYSAVGQTINYTYVLKNTGNVTLSSPFAVTDDKATVTCPATSSLAPNATLDCTASYLITQADLDAGSVTNKATATASFNGNTVTSNQATATVTAVKSPALSLTKSATPSTYDAVGQTISYSYVIKNTGNVTLSGPFSVSDDKATVTCTQPADGALSPNETMSCTASYTITQADLDASKVTNKATATNGTVTSNEATATVNAVAHPNLSLVKTATPATYSKVGDVVSYSYEVKNIGNVALSSPFAVTDDKATVTCSATSSLAVGASITCSASYTITQADLDAGSVTNHATATATFGGNTVTSNPAQATVNAVQTRALTLDKTAQETTYAKVGDVLHYSYQVTNSGNVTLHDAITVSDNKTTATCPALPAGGLIPGASVTCTASYTISQADLDAGSVTNVASATSGTTTSNTDTVTVPATQSPALLLAKSASPATYTSAGQTISYSYVLTNTGNVTLSGPFAVTDDKASVTCPSSVTSLAFGDTLTCTASHTVTQAEVDAGSITNRATATAAFGGSTVTSNEATATVTANQMPALLLDKSASPSTYNTVGQIISYTYVLKNTGNLTLAGPLTVSDNKASVTCPPDATLAPDASITCSATYTITQTDLDAGFVTNTAMGHASFGGSAVNSNEDSATVNALQQGGLGLTKTATPPTYSKLGDVVSYSYVVQNTGNVTLAGPFTVNDDIVGAVSCPLGSLAPQATVTCTATYTITQANLDAGSLTNHATATDGTLTSNPAQATVTAVQTRALAIDKTAQETTYAKAGDVLHYSYQVTNAGNVTLQDAIVVSDDKAADESCPALPAGGLAPGASITCTASYTITQADLDAGKVTNVASAASGTTVSPTDDVTVPATQTPTLTLKKSANPMTYTTVGQTITYDYLLTNSGNVTLVSPFAVGDDRATVTCPAAVTSLAPGATLNCTATYTISQADLDGGNVTNLATATAKFGDTTVTSNQDTATVTAVQSPALSLVKTATPPTYDAAGQTISYSYVVKNIGNVTLTGPITVSDDKATVLCPALDIAGLKPGASITCGASYAVTQVDLDTGSVTNHASASAKFGDTTVPSNPAEATVNAVQAPALSLVKSADPLTYDHVGQSIAYSYVLTNIGNVTLVGPITVSDDKATVLCPALDVAGLKPGVSITCTATYAITQADLDTGSVTNTATGHAQTIGGTPVNSNNASATVTAEQKPALAIDKTAQETTYANAGDVIHYSYVVTNSGNVTLHTAIVISDDKAADESCPALPAGELAPGASITCTASYTITQADLDLGSLTNVASAASGNTVSPTDTVTVPATQAPKLTIDKTATETTYAHVGEVLHYNYVVTNSGNVTLYNITVIDDKAVVTCEDTSGGLAPAAFITCTASYTITQADIDAGAVTNTAYAKSGNTQSPPDTVTVEAVKQPALTLSKVATPHFSDPVKVGDTIDYTLTATNTGNLTLTNVTITDAKLGTLSCTPDQPVTLAPTGTLVCTGTYAITQADIDAGKVDNTGIAKSDQTPPTETPNEVPVPKAPALTIDKTATPSTYSKVGDVIAYSYLVANSGNVTLVAPISGTDDKATVTCPALPAGGLTPGAFITCTASYTITQADIDAGLVTNSAYATSGTTLSNTDTETVTAIQSPALTIDKTASPMTYSKVGDIITYSYVVTNSGNVTLHDPISVTDDKAAAVNCPALDVAGLKPSFSITCSASYIITQADLDAGKVTNSAYATSGTTQSPPDTVTVPAAQTPAISLAKTASPTTYNAVGQTITYSYVITNTGNVTLAGPFTISDDKATVTCPATSSLAPAAFITCTASYKVTQTDLDAGSVTNKATATNGTVTSNEASQTVNAVQSPAITLTKTATPTYYSKVGDVIQYTLVAKNTGNVTLKDVSISDPKLGALTCTLTQPAILAPNATITCTGSYTIQASDLIAGQVNRVTNTATVNATGPAGQPVSATATATVYQQTGALLPTQTTCQMYAAGPSAWPAMYSNFNYQVKGGKINSVSPGVIFYYNTLTAPSASFTLTVVEKNSLTWKPMLVQDLGQAILYTSDCSKASGVTVTTQTAGSTYTVTFTVTGATPGATYYIGIKYSPQNLIGQAVKAVGKVYPTSTYSFETTGLSGSATSIDVKPK